MPVRLSNSNLYRLQDIINTSLFKILITRNITVVDNCLYILNMLPVSYALDLRTFKFLCKQSTSTNLLVCYIASTVQDSMRHCVLNIYINSRVSYNIWFMVTFYGEMQLTCFYLLSLSLPPSVCVCVYIPVLAKDG